MTKARTWALVVCLLAVAIAIVILVAALHASPIVIAVAPATGLRGAPGAFDTRGRRQTLASPLSALAICRHLGRAALPGR